MITDIDDGLVRAQGRRLDSDTHKPSWAKAVAHLKEGEKIVVISGYKIWPLYAFVVNDEKGYSAVTESKCKGVYAAGPELLKHERPFVPYDGP